MRMILRSRVNLARVESAHGFDHKSAPMDASFGPSVSAVSSGPIGISRCMSMSPVSSPASIRMVVTPVTDSPLAIAHWIGAAPRYFGSRDACKFKISQPGKIDHPLRDDAAIADDYDRVASGPVAANWSRNSALFLMVAGCRTAMPRRIAASFTGETASFPFRAREAGRVASPPAARNDRPRPISPESGQRIEACHRKPES
jgi:hypothetical protein